MTTHLGELTPPNRLMLTPGPSSVDPRVYRAMSTPLVGHLDPWFNSMISDVQGQLRDIFQTTNKTTFPISASGSGGIEASVVNPLEPGDEAIICVNGHFSERMFVIAERTGAKIHRIDAEPGKPVDAEAVRRAGAGRKIKIVGLAHGETSTGVVHDLDDFRKVADELGALLVVDTVATLAGVPLNVDKQRIDICFSGSQKAISGPPGMSPITISPAAEKVLLARKTKVQSWYFDLTVTMTMWGKERSYHHTPPIPLLYGLREAMRIVLEEGLEPRWKRQAANRDALVAGIEAMGLKMFVPNPKDRLVTVSAVSVPDGLKAQSIRTQLLEEFNIEIASGFGALKEKFWRVGLMGWSNQKNHVLLFLAAFEKCLLDHGFNVPSGAGVGAAIRSYQEQPVAVGA